MNPAQQSKISKEEHIVELIDSACQRINLLFHAAPSYVSQICLKSSSFSKHDCLFRISVVMDIIFYSTIFLLTFGLFGTKFRVTFMHRDNELTQGSAKDGKQHYKNIKAVVTNTKSWQQPLNQYYFCGYTQGEVTSQNLWSRYDRHFVGITRHVVWS